MNKCPYCGSSDGVYTTFVGIQYYQFNGEPDGHSTDTNESKFAKCRRCGRRILLKRILDEAIVERKNNETRN